MTRLRKRFFDCKSMSMEEATLLGTELAELQRDIMWWVADLARYAEAKWPETHHQVWPEWVSPGLIARAAGVGKAYPTEAERVHEATYAQYMQVAGKPDRQSRLASIVDQGLTTDESRAALKSTGDTNKPRWLLAVDVNYFIHKFWHSAGGGVEAASNVATWIQRTVERLKEKGLSDVACCFDSHESFRKVLTKDWEDRYKGNRGPKDQELVYQLTLVRELLERHGFACVSAEGYESDDCIASFAKTFPGKVAILAADKDLKQCLAGERVVMLTDVTWTTNEHSGDMFPEYHWYTEKPHPRIKCKNLLDDTGLTPRQFIDFQCLMGDPTDCIKGAIGIGEKGAKDLVQWFETAEGAIQAAKESDPRIKEAKRLALIEFEAKLDVTRKLVTLVDNLTLPTTTRL